MSGVQKSPGYSEWENWRDAKRGEEKKAVDEYKEKCIKPVVKAAKDAFFSGKNGAEKDFWNAGKKGAQAFADNSDCRRGPQLPTPGNFLGEKIKKGKNGG